MTRETERVQNFINQSLPGLLQVSALELKECPHTELSDVLHRLRGTLGTYQQVSLAGALHALEEILRENSSKMVAEFARLRAIELIHSRITELQS